MADIFVAYAREDERKAQLVRNTLERYGWSVFWDKDLLAGTIWEGRLEQEIRQAKCVVVLWSVNSTNSRWVRAEANDAAERNVMVPVVIEESVKLPFGLRQFQSFDWFGESPPPQFDRLIERLEKLAGAPKRSIDCPGCRRRISVTSRGRYCPECGCALLTFLCPVCRTEQITGGLEEGDVLSCGRCTSFLIVASVEPLELEPVVICPVCRKDIEVEEGELDVGDSYTCEHCGTDLKVVGAGPLELEPV